MTKRAVFFLIVAFGSIALLANTTHPAISQPTALSDSYLPLLTFNGIKLKQVTSSGQNNEQMWVFGADDQSTSVRIDSFSCAQTVCAALFESAFKGMYQMVSANAGKFELISSSELRGTWNDTGTEVHRFAFAMPGSLLVWSLGHSGPIPATYMEEYRQKLEDTVNQQRFDAAQSLGNIELGSYGTEFREYAEHLLEKGEKAEALKVLQAVISTSPMDYKAQLEFATNTPDTSASRTSASIVFENAESPDLVTKGAAILHLPDPQLETPPFLEEGETGLQVILVPLAPCDVRLLEAAGKIFTQITSVPVKIRRLKDNWTWHSPDRIPNERAIQQLIVQSRNQNVDFSNWNLAQYEAELIRLSSTADPLTRYKVNNILSQSSGNGGQYTVDSYITMFAHMIAPFRSDDPRTVFIGVTNANISLGDANFVFSAGQVIDGRPSTILSYYMMAAGPSGQAFESRNRLTSRIGKQLVPAVFAGLGIPRSVDPNDPSSYANSVDRVDQKSLELSQSSKDALDKLRK